MFWQTSTAIRFPPSSARVTSIATTIVRRRILKVGLGGVAAAGRGPPQRGEVEPGKEVAEPGGRARARRTTRRRCRCGSGTAGPRSTSATPTPIARSSCSLIASMRHLSLHHQIARRRSNSATTWATSAWLEAVLGEGLGEHRLQPVEMRVVDDEMAVDARIWSSV
jgi:hypothetical protein